MNEITELDPESGLVVDNAKRVDPVDCAIAPKVDGDDRPRNARSKPQRQKVTEPVQVVATTKKAAQNGAKAVGPIQEGLALATTRPTEITPIKELFKFWCEVNKKGSATKLLPDREKDLATLFELAGDLELAKFALKGLAVDQWGDEPRPDRFKGPAYSYTRKNGSKREVCSDTLDTMIAQGREASAPADPTMGWEKVCDDEANFLQEIYGQNSPESGTMEIGHGHGSVKVPDPKLYLLFARLAAATLSKEANAGTYSARVDALMTNSITQARQAIHLAQAKINRETI